MATLNEYEDYRTLEVFQFLREYIEVRGISPSLVEIAKGCLMSKGNLPSYLGRLEGWGWIERIYRIPRSIRIAENAPSYEEFTKLLALKKPKDSP